MTTHTDLAAQKSSWQTEIQRAKDLGRMFSPETVERLIAAALSTERLAGGGEPVAWSYTVGKTVHIHNYPLEHYYNDGNRYVEGVPLYTTPPPQAERVPLSAEQCEWTIQDDDYGGDTWQSSCGELWSFIDGGPKENRVSFCHHCGKKVGIGTPKEST